MKNTLSKSEIIKRLEKRLESVDAVQLRSLGKSNIVLGLTTNSLIGIAVMTSINDYPRKQKKKIKNYWAKYVN